MRYSERLRLDTYLRTFGSVKAMPPLRQPEWHREDTVIYWLAILDAGEVNAARFWDKFRHGKWRDHDW